MLDGTKEEVMATYRGKPTCICGAAWLPAFEAKLAEYGIKVRFTQLIGGYGPSAGTHADGLCFDLVVIDPGPRSVDAAYDLVVLTARQMGADGTWERPRNWDGRGGIRHVHGLGNGCPHLAAAAILQQIAVRNRKNGLANGGPDTGPRPLSGLTWQQGIARYATASKSQEDDMPSYGYHNRTKPQALKKGTWKGLAINDNGDASIAFSNHTVTGTAYLAISGLPEGAEMQVEALVVKGDTWGAAPGGHLGVTEIIGTRGKAYAQVPFTAATGSDQRLRLRALALDDGVSVDVVRVKSISWQGVRK